LPTFKNGFGHEKPSVYAGLRVQSPLTHFYFYLNTIKRLINIYNMANKSGQVGYKGFYEKFTTHIMKRIIFYGGYDMGNFAELENKLWAESNENYLLYVKKILKAYNRY
jgi:hypothetical protein